MTSIPKDRDICRVQKEVDRILDQTLEEIHNA